MGSISPIKILIVAVVALVVLGPERLPEMTRRAGKAWGDFRDFRQTMEAQVRGVVGDVPGLGELRGLTDIGIRSTVASAVQGFVSPVGDTSAQVVATTGLSADQAPPSDQSPAAGQAAPPDGQAPPSDQAVPAAGQAALPGPGPSGAWSPPGPAAGAGWPPRIRLQPVYPADDPSLN